MTPDEAYFNNMALSQARTRSALQHVLAIPTVQGDRAWLQYHLTANGLSSSKLVLDANGRENPAKSQRVEFRVRTDADAKIAKIIESAHQ
jgi:outer membrane protein OmpA-like peptidoglycan-associated protein